MELYKVLSKDLTSPFQNFKFELGKKYVCRDFDSDATIDCSRGFYATDIDGLPYAYNINRSVFRVKVGGKSVEYNQFKRRYSTIEIVSEVSLNELLEIAKPWDDKLGYKLTEVLNPIHPFKIIPPDAILDSHIENLKQWDSVWDSVGASVGDSVGVSVWVSVWDSVWDSVRASVRASVRDSVGDSVGAYIGSFFPNISQWKYIKHAPNIYPFLPAVILWKQGLVPSFDGKLWRLHGGEKGEILWKGKI